MFRHNFLLVFRFIALNLIKNKNLYRVQKWSRYEYIFITLFNLFIIGGYGISQYFSIEWYYPAIEKSDDYKLPYFKATHDNAGHSVFFLFLMLFGLFGLTTLESISRPPSNNPLQSLRKGIVTSKKDVTAEIQNNSNHQNDDKKKSVLVCIGDSITHGRCSANYVDMIADFTKEPNKLLVVNAGQNSICSWPYLQTRIEEVVSCNPSYISILIGTNDIKGIYNNQWMQQSINRWSIPEDLSFHNYKQNLQSIVEKLLDETNAKIAVCTLPPMGENMHCKAIDFVRKANEIVIDVVTKFEKKSGRVSCIHIFKEFEKILKVSKRSEKGNFHRVENFLSTNFWMSFCNVIFGLSLTKLSKIVNNQLLSDSLHLNEDGAKIVSTLVAQWISKCELSSAQASNLYQEKVPST